MSLVQHTFGCSCSNCTYVRKHTAHWTSRNRIANKYEVRVGDRVLVQGLFQGTVKYVGYMDNTYADGQVYAGIKLDEPGRS